MESNIILDREIRRERTPEEDSEFHLMRLEAEQSACNMQYGRYALYLLCAIRMVLAAAMLFVDNGTNLTESEDITYFGLGIALLVESALYISLALASFRYAKIAFSLAVGLYVLFILTDAVDNPISLVKGIIFKGVIIYFLIKAVQSSIQMERIRERAAELGIEEEELA